MRIIGGNPANALRDLTGAPSEKSDHRMFDSEDELWDYLHSAEKRKWLLCCGSDNKTIKKLGGSKKSGVVGGHAYSILDSRELLTENGPVRLIQIRNPWAYNNPTLFLYIFLAAASGLAPEAITTTTGLNPLSTRSP